MYRNRIRHLLKRLKEVILALDRKACLSGPLRWGTGTKCVVFPLWVQEQLIMFIFLSNPFFPALHLLFIMCRLQILFKKIWIKSVIARTLFYLFLWSPDDIERADTETDQLPLKNITSCLCYGITSIKANLKCDSCSQQQTSIILAFSSVFSCIHHLIFKSWTSTWTQPDFVIITTTFPVPEGKG